MPLMKSNLKLKLREEQLLWLPGTDMERGRSLVLEAAAALASGCAGFSGCGYEGGGVRHKVSRTGGLILRHVQMLLFQFRVLLCVRGVFC